MSKLIIQSNELCLPNQNLFLECVQAGADPTERVNTTELELRRLLRVLDCVLQRQQPRALVLLALGAQVDRHLLLGQELHSGRGAVRGRSGERRKQRSE